MFMPPTGVQGMRFGAAIPGIGLFAFVALMGAAFGVDAPFRQHMWVLFFTLAAFTVILMRRTSFETAAPADPSAYMDEPIRYGSIATMFWGVVGLLMVVVLGGTAAARAATRLTSADWLRR